MRQLIKIISATVILATLFSLCSCGHIWRGGSINYPEGYTGGHGISYGSSVEYYWVESYEECLDAIETIKSCRMTGAMLFGEHREVRFIGYTKKCYPKPRREAVPDNTFAFLLGDDALRNAKLTPPTRSR